MSSNFLAHAQTQATVNISSSADIHEGQFFGEGVVQIVIIDKDANDNKDDVITVDIEAESDKTSGYDSGPFSIPNTNPGSQRFEFFIVHAGSQYADGVAGDGTRLDATNEDGFDDLSDGFDGVGAPIIRFGKDAGTGVELGTGDALYDQVDFEVRYEDERIQFSYKESDGTIGTDRSVYGTDSFAYITIEDQDANLNPTEPDSFNATMSDLDALFEIGGAEFVDDVIFEETSQNSASFEARLRLAHADTDDLIPELEISSSGVSLVLRDMANYADVLASENGPSSSSSAGFTVENKDGSLEAVTPVTFGNELKLMLRDNDQNKDSKNDEALDNVVAVKVGTGDSNSNGIFETGEADQESVSMEETDDNSGTFAINAANNELKITFLSDGENPVPNNGILELKQSDIDKDVLISYLDSLNKGSSASVTSSFRLKVQTVPGQITIPLSASINDEIILELSDLDLNNNARTRDSYSFLLTGHSGNYALKRSGQPMASFGTIELRIGSAIPSFQGNLSYVLTETNVSSGMFYAKVDLRDILASAGISADDGDRVEVKYIDRMARTSRESSATLTLQRSALAADFTRDTLPIPPKDNPSDPAPESSAGQLLGTRVLTSILITDVSRNTQAHSENLIPFRFANDPSSPRPAFSIAVQGNRISETIDTTAKYNGSDPTGVLGNSGVHLSRILQNVPTLRETGMSTGIFEGELRFVNTGDLETREWQDLKLVFTYYDEAGNIVKSGLAFRGNTGLVSLDKDSVRAGDQLTITVEDQDLNLDDSGVDEFRSSIDAKGTYMLSIEPDDNNLETKIVTTKSFKETGDDTGVFTATFVVGSDIPVSETDEKRINQARVIHIEYNDEMDSSGDSGEEIEFDIPVVTSEGVIQVSPDLVGPSTKLTLLVVDNDLNLNPLKSDSFEGDSKGKGIVAFRTDRKEAGRASPDLRETGPNTGVFQFELQLVPIKGGEDGLPIETDGGSEPKIGVLPGDLLAVRYEDEDQGSGESTTKSSVVEIMSWDPEFAADKESYEENDRVSITITDPDANRNSEIADSIRNVVVYGDSDRVGRTYSAIETGRDSGVFKVAFALGNGINGGSIAARNGDQVTISYEDEFPASYAQNVRDREKTDQKFQYSFVVGLRATGTSVATVSTPTLQDTSGDEIASAKMGTQVVLSTSIKNNNALSQPFVVIVEVRNSQDVTDSLVWQSGTLNPNSSIDVGMSWLPSSAGKYEARTFVISDLQHPEVLSAVSHNQMEVIS
jgi:hypothetical protein